MGADGSWLAPWLCSWILWCDIFVESLPEIKRKYSLELWLHMQSEGKYHFAESTLVNHAFTSCDYPVGKISKVQGWCRGVPSFGRREINLHPCLFGQQSKWGQYSRSWHDIDGISEYLIQIDLQMFQIKDYTEMQENTWAMLRESSTHQGASHAT